MERIEQGYRHHQVDGSEYDETLLQEQLCAMLQIAMNDGLCMDHAKERLIKHLADLIEGYRQEEPLSQTGCLDDGSDS
jgi:hypothetical protein